MNAVCWHEDGRIGRAHACSVDGYACGERDLIHWGRCRSGRRWFWTAQVWRLDQWRRDQCDERYGWADTEAEAVTAAQAAVVELAAGRPAVAYPRHGVASERLKAINAEKRRARPHNGGVDPGAVEYLYARHDLNCHYDGTSCGCDDLDGRAKWDYHTVRFQITKKTAKRVYYLRREDGTGYVDRGKLEADGEVYNRGVHWSADDSHLYAQPPEPPDRYLSRPVAPDVKAELSRLRREMADAHPDRGGTNEAFREARGRYTEAKSRAGVR